jgi:acyl-CoA synthetase (AMP-forming)/AMP-acid ligase II
MARRPLSGEASPMSTDVNLARSVISALSFSQASAGEVGEAPLGASAMSAAATALAVELSEAGVAPHEPIVLFISNGPKDLIGFLGLWLANCVAAPIHVITPVHAVHGLVVRLGARFAIRAGKLERIGGAEPPLRPLLDKAALIVFTSGSTGQPKGVVVRIRPFSGSYRSFLDCWDSLWKMLSSSPCNSHSYLASGSAYSV